MINAFCKNRGWLFEDLKRSLQQAGCVVSEQPILTAKAWICIRSKEYRMVPEPSRCVLQVHDMTSTAIEGFGCVSYVHQEQQERWGIDGIVSPIGSRDVPQSSLPDRPTIGFFCRDLRGEKRPGLFGDAVALARQHAEFEVLMIGHGLEAITDLGTYEQRGAGVDDYARIDALVTCSVSAMVPLSAYEAAAAGRAVITTPRQWDWDMVRKAEDADGLAALIVDQVQHRRLYTPRKDFTREGWAREQVALARSLA